MEIEIPYSIPHFVTCDYRDSRKTHDEYNCYADCQYGEETKVAEFLFALIPSFSPHSPFHID
jgi:hypothetical protein